MIEKLFKLIHTLPVFALDLCKHLRNESHASKFLSYRMMRLSYIYSDGRSRAVLRSIFRLFRPVKGAAADARVMSKLRADGIVRVGKFLDRGTVDRLYAYFSQIPGHVVGPKFQLLDRVTISEARNVCRLQFDHQDVVQAPGVVALLAHDAILDVAATYFSCEPILATISAWWSIPNQGASREDLSGAAQLYHMDYDYPEFIKFFFYLTNVTADDGPFTYIRTTHRQNADRRDGRYSDEEIDARYRTERYEAVGNAGDVIIADTSGIHKGKPPVKGNRLVLQFEYACSRLGNSASYPLYPRTLKPECKYRHTFDIFCR